MRKTLFIKTDSRKLRKKDKMKETIKKKKCKKKKEEKRVRR